jgi:hypothetical protein
MRNRMIREHYSAYIAAVNLKSRPAMRKKSSCGPVHTGYNPPCKGHIALLFQENLQ